MYRRSPATILNLIKGNVTVDGSAIFELALAQQTTESNDARKVIHMADVINRCWQGSPLRVSGLSWRASPGRFAKSGVAWRLRCV